MKWFSVLCLICSISHADMLRKECIEIILTKKQLERLAKQLQIPYNTYKESVWQPGPETLEIRVCEGVIETEVF